MFSIDYVFAGSSAHSQINDTSIQFINKSWTDHALLSFTYTVGVSNIGRGTWRADPYLARNPLYVQKLNQELDNYVLNELSSTLPVQEQWDHIKNMVKKVTQHFCRVRASKKKLRMRELQSHYNHILRYCRHDLYALQTALSDIEAQITKLQEEEAEISRLRAGKKWLKYNEKSAVYLTRTIAERQSARHFKKILHPATGAACEDT